MRRTIDVQLDFMQVADWEAVSQIYDQGIKTGNATFETDLPEWEVWNERHLPECRLVAKRGTQVVGWAALSPLSVRPVYRGVVEVSVYVAREFQQRGIGTILLRRLVLESEKRGIWTLQATILVENRASIRLHEQCGFVRVGIRRRIGQLRGRWRDVLLMEKRSNRVGQ